LILITGGLGLIGTHTTRALLDEGESCVLVQRREVADIPAILSGGDVVIERADVTDLDELLAIGDRHKITGIVHLAGSAPWPPGAYQPIEGARAALASLLNVFESAVRWNVPRAGIASTIGVYGGVTQEPPYREDLPLPMLSGHPIPGFKKIGELLADHLAGETGLEMVNFRISGIWGPLGRPQSVFSAVPQLVHAAARHVEPDLSSLRSPVFADDGSDWFYVRDCGRAIAALMLAGKLNHSVYNVGSGRLTTYRELLAAIKAADSGVRIELPSGHGAQPDVFLDITRLREDTGYEPRYDIERAVADYMAWLRAGNER
jgi:UDP-glucose 4-epimerase